MGGESRAATGIVLIAAAWLLLELVRRGIIKNAVSNALFSSPAAAGQLAANQAAAGALQSQGAAIDTQQSTISQLQQQLAGAQAAASSAAQSAASGVGQAYANTTQQLQAPLLPGGFSPFG